MSALPPGRWVPRRGVLVWKPIPEAPIRRPKSAPAPTIDRNLVACPTCRATVTQTCRTKGGNPTTPHADRIVSRRCGCGEPVATRKQYCERCRARARKQTYRLREIRKATKLRRAA